MTHAGFTTAVYVRAQASGTDCNQVVLVVHTRIRTACFLSGERRLLYTAEAHFNEGVAVAARGLVYRQNNAPKPVVALFFSYRTVVALHLMAHNAHANTG